MLPKPEKNKKSLNNPEQLDLVESISQENKVARKRRFIIIFLLLTVGLSMGFWIYHGFSNMVVNHNYPKINFKLSQFTTKKPSFETTVSLDSYLPKDSQNWTVYIQTLSTNKKSFTYSHQSDNLKVEEIKQSLSKLSVANNTLTQTNLPLGVQVKEIIEYKDNNLVVNSLVTVPQKEIIFIFKISTNNPDQDKNNIASIIEQAYYQIMNSD